MIQTPEILAVFHLSLKPETQHIIFKSGGELIVFLFFLNMRAPFDVQPPPVITGFRLVPEAQKSELRSSSPALNRCWRNCSWAHLVSYILQEKWFFGVKMGCW